MTDKRRRIWRHNGFQGSISMALRTMHEISMTDSASPHACQLADEIREKLAELSIELKTNRIDP